MTFDLRRVPRILVRCAGALLVLALALASVAPANSATGPKIVSVDITGNLHVPTATIMAVVQARPGEPYDPKIVQDDLARINALGYFADIAPPLVRARPDGIAITYRVVENPVITKIAFTGNTKGAERHAAGTDGSFGRTSLQHQHVPSGRAQDQQLLRAHRLRRPSPDARQGHQPRSEDRRRDARRSTKA